MLFRSPETPPEQTSPQQPATPTGKGIPAARGAGHPAGARAPAGTTPSAAPQTPPSAAPTKAAESEKPELTFEQQIAELEKSLNIDTPEAMELKSEMEKRYAESKKDRTVSALAQGIGAMLASQTPYVGQALGAGLIAGAGAYDTGMASLEKQQAAMDALRLRPELMKQANRQVAFQALMDQEKSKIAARAKHMEMQTKFGQDVALEDIKGRQQKELKTMDISGEQVKAARALRDAQTLELFKKKLPMSTAEEFEAFNKWAATQADSGKDLQTLIDEWSGGRPRIMNPGTPAPQPQSQNVGNTGMRITPAR